MGGRGKKKPQGEKASSGGKRTAVAPSASLPSTSRAKTPILPSRYNFSPATNPQTPPPVVPSKSPSAHVRNYPPPTELFQTSLSQNRPSSPSPKQPTPPPNQHRSSSVSNQLQNPQQIQPRDSSQQRRQPRFSDERTSPSSHGQNSHEDGDEASNEDGALFTSYLSEDQERVLYALLTKPGREEYTTVLSPTEKPNTTW